MGQPRSIPEGVRAGVNKTSAVIPAGVVVTLDGTNLEGVILPPAATAFIYGITMGAIAVGAVGDIQTRGRALGLASAGIAMGAKVGVVAETGELVTYASGSVVGIAVQAGATGELFEVELMGPNG